MLSKDTRSNSAICTDAAECICGTSGFEMSDGCNDISRKHLLFILEHLSAHDEAEENDGAGGLRAKMCKSTAMQNHLISFIFIWPSSDTHNSGLCQIIYVECKRKQTKRKPGIWLQKRNLIRNIQGFRRSNERYEMHQRQKFLKVASRSIRTMLQGYKRRADATGVALTYDFQESNTARTTNVLLMRKSATTSHRE